MMIGVGEIYKVVVAVAPLYTALGLGYGSVRWWHIFTPEQCEAINLLVSYLTLPFFTFEFTIHADPFSMNYQFILADVISKLVIVSILFAWAKCSSKGSYGWSITTFSLSTLTNSLVVGVPMLNAMYGPSAQDLVVQSSIFQAIVWLVLLLFVLEFRKVKIGIPTKPGVVSNQYSHVVSIDISPSSKDTAAAATTNSNDQNTNGVADHEVLIAKPSFCSLMRIIWFKLALNPNSYASIVGITWAFISNRWHFEMPSIMEGSILVMSKAGTGMAMFSMGLFMALQEKLVASGPSLMAFGMVMKFIAGPAAMAIGAIAVGLRGDVLRIAIIQQAALPQSITSFIFARDYGLHADVLSTAVIFGMLVSLPVLVAYYFLFGLMS
ncbi:Membrane transport protein [Dioscorea alata]|uniref:Membrane transport protein n=1 Tax=Dioscorea alata TaxID=55571 RepID=A0ACB7WAG2_DIOAL|nr:Membrane transport protein [Dioscorea alata]